MKKRLLFILCLFFVAASSASAQQQQQQQQQTRTRSVTNSDLEKFRQKRLQAEQEYRENYARLGFPSPEELERMREQSRIERAELSRRIEAENLERERMDLERARVQSAQTQNDDAPYRDEHFTRGGFIDYSSFGSAPYGFYDYSGGYGYGNNRSNRYARGEFNRGGRRGANRGGGSYYGNQPYIRYQNNLPVFVAPPRPIFAPRTSAGGRRN